MNKKLELKSIKKQEPADVDGQSKRKMHAAKTKADSKSKGFKKIKKEAKHVPKKKDSKKGKSK